MEKSTVSKASQLSDLALGRFSEEPANGGTAKWIGFDWNKSGESGQGWFAFCHYFSTKIFESITDSNAETARAVSKRYKL